MLGLAALLHSTCSWQNKLFPDVLSLSCKISTRTKFPTALFVVFCAVLTRAHHNPHPTSQNPGSTCIFQEQLPNHGESQNIYLGAHAKCHFHACLVRLFFSKQIKQGSFHLFFPGFKFTR